MTGIRRSCNVLTYLLSTSRRIPNSCIGAFSLGVPTSTSTCEELNFACFLSSDA